MRNSPFPIHQRRMKVFKSEQKSDTKSFLREIIENIRLAEWNKFTEEAATCHIFMSFTKDDEAKKSCYKILSDLPQGCTKTLMEKIEAIEAFPDNKPFFVKSARDREDGIPERKVCKDCKFKGHTTAECWGKCQHSGKHGHKSHLCRTKAKLDQ